MTSLVCCSSFIGGSCFQYFLSMTFLSGAPNFNS
jgi:hypothetical protein